MLLSHSPVTAAYNRLKAKAGQREDRVKEICAKMKQELEEYSEEEKRHDKKKKKKEAKKEKKDKKKKRRESAND